MFISQILKTICLVIFGTSKRIDKTKFVAAAGLLRPGDVKERLGQPSIISSIVGSDCETEGGPAALPKKCFGPTEENPRVGGADRHLIGFMSWIIDSMLESSDITIFLI